MGQGLGVLGTPQAHCRPWRPHLWFQKWGALPICPKQAGVSATVLGTGHPPPHHLSGDRGPFLTMYICPQHLPGLLHKMALMPSPL